MINISFAPLILIVYMISRFSLVIFCVCLIIASGIIIMKYRQITEMKKKLRDQRIILLLTQIQSHFIYNSLISIQQLCKIDPLVAESAIGNFSKYLRYNLENIENNGLILLSQELKHIENYIYIVKIRFGDKINIEYDIKINDFYLPALTIQPLVENAVKYGITRKAEGGKIFVCTYDDERYIYIKVIDNGVGYDVGTVKTNNGRLPVGIKNIKERIKIQLDGRLHIQSTFEKGTTVTITIPKDGVS